MNSNASTTTREEIEAAFIRLVALIISVWLASASTFFFFFNDTATTEIYTLSLHDALPISLPAPIGTMPSTPPWSAATPASAFTVPSPPHAATRSEEHTSELQSRVDIV